MDTYYTLLGIPAQASAEEIESAYHRQRERYSPERVRALGDDFRRIAEERLAALERAYAVLADPTRRQEYDRGIGASSRGATRPSARSGITRREIAMTVGGALLGLLIIGLVWAYTGRTAPAAMPSVGETRRPAPEFTLPGIDDSTISLSDYRGKVVLINFWGTWCEPCKEETPALQAVYSKLHDQGLVVIGIDLIDQERSGADGRDDVRKFVERYGVTYPIALDVGGETARAFQIFPLPTSYFVDQTGTIRYVRAGPIAADEVEALFTKLQQEATARR